MNVDIHIDALKLTSFLKNIPGKLDRARKDSLQQSALKVQNRAKENAPVLTGHLRRSITHEIQRDMAYVGTDVEYAEVREYHTQSKPDGYLRPALSASEKEIQKIFDKNFEKALKS